MNQVRSHDPGRTTDAAFNVPTGLDCSRFARRYWGNHCCCLFLRVLRCFTSPRSLLPAYGFSGGWPGMSRTGLPHSEIPGSKRVFRSPRLIAAYHVLHRLPTPRHPPCALSSLTPLRVTLIVHYFLPSDASLRLSSQKSLAGGKKHGIDVSCRSDFPHQSGKTDLSKNICRALEAAGVM